MISLKALLIKKKRLNMQRGGPGKRPLFLIFGHISCIITTMRITIPALIAFLIFLASPLWALGLKVNLNTWNLTVNSSNLGPPAEAGQQLTSTYTSATVTSTLTVTGAGNSQPWRINIRKSDGSWNSQFSLEIERTSDGSGSGTITPDPGFIQVRDTDTVFITGTGNRKDMNCLYRLSNITLLVPPGNYSTTIIFTLTN